MIIFVVWYCRDLFVFNIFLYLNLCGKNCFLKKLVGQNVRQTFIFIGQFLRWVGQCLMSDCYFKHCFFTLVILPVSDGQESGLIVGEYFYSYQASVQLLYSLEILENLCFLDVFRWHRNWTLAWNGLNCTCM